MIDEDSSCDTSLDGSSTQKYSSELPLSYKNIIEHTRETIDTASRILRKKVPCMGHFMTSRHLWIQTVPTKDCDVVIMFPNSAEDITLEWLLSKLQAGATGLVVNVRHHSSSDNYGFYVRAPFNILLKAAEEVHLPKSLKSEHGGGLKEFIQGDSKCFEGVEMEESFFTTQERQHLVLHLLQTLRAGQGDSLFNIKLIDGQPVIPKCISAGLISQVFPLHDLEALKHLQTTWVRAFFNKQPLDEICEYFGVKVAMYFAWLGHYTTALIVPAVLGFVFYIGFGNGDQVAEDIGFVLFSFFNVLWFSIYLEAWKRYCAELAYKWGTLDQRDELLVEPRPLFQGTLQISPVTQRLEPSYPPWKRYLFRYFITLPVIALCLVVVFIVMMINLKLQDWWDEELEARGYMFFFNYLPKIILAIGITLLDEAYYKVALWLNDKVSVRQLLSFIVLHCFLPSGSREIERATGSSFNRKAGDW